ncbi:hypothetical protein [Arsenicicoccus dermatophilus]|uniref:hypothetical protein n=1 Tax=Arsenicicoccus dermatophilus TaxID=1076331 RepID=UPI003916FB03
MQWYTKPKEGNPQAYGKPVKVVRDAGTRADAEYNPVDDNSTLPCRAFWNDKA